jgi:hypothetical protein
MSSFTTKVAFMASGTLLMGAAALAAVPAGKAFPSADAAAQALVHAAKANDVNELILILGPSSKEIISTGDKVADEKVRRDFTSRAAQKMKLAPYHGRQNEKTMLVGDDQWPLPIPIVKVGDKWYFDTAKAKDEILNRRIGSNELDAIEVCRGYVEAQNNFAAINRSDAGTPIYAQKVFSSPGQHDGLYWQGAPDSGESPIGNFIAKAFAEGYTKRGEPYHGYYFKILTAQGKDAPGGEMSYLEDGTMTKGYAMIAWPANYGSTGIMTFLVSKTGIVYQKNLGPATPRIASTYNAYNPDSTWTPVETTASR